MCRQDREANVIDDELISEALRGSVPQPVTDAEILDTIAEVTELRLSFKDVLKIDNLQGFQTLQVLCLDNNIIKNINNLDHLVSLTWLDLSFNCIREISGLDNLLKLTDLSLFNNMITNIAGIEPCKHLQCLSLGNNNISALDNIVKLRHFRNLKLLNLEGNPISREGEYRMYILAYVNDLTYLDYSMVTKAETVAAREQYQDELLDVEEKEALEEEKVGREIAATRHTEKLKDANLSVVETIFDDMFADDMEMAKLRHLPGITDIINSFQSEVESASDLFLTAGLARDQQKQQEGQQFESAFRKLRVRYAGESVCMMENFGRTKKTAVKALMARPSVDLLDLEPLWETLRKLISALMDLEMRQVEQCEEIIGEYEAKYFELKQACLEGQQSFFRLIEEHENNFTRDLVQLMNELLDKMAKGDLPEDLSDEANSLLVDRDACMNAITGSHDIHVGKLYRREDEAKHNEESLFRKALRKYREEEHARSRNRITELNLFEDACTRELNGLIADNAHDEADCETDIG